MQINYRIFTKIPYGSITWLWFQTLQQDEVLYDASVGLQEITEMSVFDRKARLKYAEKIEDVEEVLEEVRGLSADQFEIIKV